MWANERAKKAWLVPVGANFAFLSVTSSFLVVPAPQWASRLPFWDTLVLQQSLDGFSSLSKTSPRYRLEKRISRLRDALGAALRNTTSPRVRCSIKRVLVQCVYTVRPLVKSLLRVEERKNCMNIYIWNIAFVERMGNCKI